MSLSGIFNRIFGFAGTVPDRNVVTADGGIVGGNGQAIPQHEALKNCGNEYLARGEIKAAEQCYLDAVKIQPDYAEAWNNLGYLYKDQGRYNEAMEALLSALSHN